MAYGSNYGYPMYQQQYQQPPQDQLAQLRGMQYQQQMQPPAQPQMLQQGPTWVQGEAGAKSYIVAPNTTVILLDIETPGRMYIKSTNQAGMPSMQAYEYTEVNQTPQIAPRADDMQKQFVTREEYDAKIAELTSRLNMMVPFTVPTSEGGTAHE